MTTFAKPLMSMMTALAVTLALFWLMNLMIRNDEILEKLDSKRSYLNFIRIDPEQNSVQTKDRKISSRPFSARSRRVHIPNVCQHRYGKIMQSTKAETFHNEEQKER